jgi:hypothetical protein
MSQIGRSSIATQRRLDAQNAPQPVVPPAPTLGQVQMQKTAVNPIKVDRSGITAQSALARDRAKEGESLLLQQSSDAIARKLAAQGGGPGGVDLKLNQMATDASGQRLADANEGILTQEQAAMAQAGQLEQQLNLQAQEAQAARDLQKYQADSAAELQRYGIEAGRYDAKNTQDAVLKQQEFENLANTKTNIMNTIISMKNSGIPPEQVGAVLKGLNIEGLGIDMGQFAGVPGLTTSAAPKKTPAQIADEAYRNKGTSNKTQPGTKQQQSAYGIDARGK